MFKKETDSNKVKYVRQASADVASGRGRKKKATPDVSTLATSFVMKTKKQPATMIAVSFSIPENFKGDDDAQIQYLNEQLTNVNREIEKLNNKKDQISDLLMELLNKKRKRQDMRDEADELNESNNRFSFNNQSRIRSSSQYGSQKKNMARFRDDPFHNEGGSDDAESVTSNQSQRGSNKKGGNDVSNILNELQTNKSLIKSKMMDSNLFNNNNNNNISTFSHTLNAQAANDTSTLYQSFMHRESSQEPLGSRSKLDEYNKLKDRCLWQHFDYKEPVQNQLKTIDELQESELKELAKTFGIKSNDKKLLKENLKNIYSFLSRNKYPDEYLREFKTCIHDKIDIL